MEHVFWNKADAVDVIFAHIQQVLKGQASIIVAIVGGSASGKTEIAQSLQQKLGSGSILVSQDNFMKGDDFDGKASAYGWDDPENFSFDESITALTRLKKGESVTVPIFDMVAHKRKGKKQLTSRQVILWEGIYGIKTVQLQELCNLVIYIEAPFMVRFVRRIGRYLERGQNDPSLPARQMFDFVQKAHEELVVLQRQDADIVLRYQVRNNLEQEVERQFRNSKRATTQPALMSFTLDKVSLNLYPTATAIVKSGKILYSAEVGKETIERLRTSWPQLLTSY